VGPMAEKKRSRLLTKIAVAAVVVTLLGFLFIWSLESTRSEPYTIDRALDRRWTLVLDQAETPGAPLLSLRTEDDVAGGLFRQVFLRTMESMNAATASSIPVVLRAEFDRALAARMSPQELLEAAAAAGLESARHEPRCLAHRRVSQPGATRQVYFAVMDAPAVVRFRQQLAERAGAGSGFDPHALAPVMFVAATDPSFHRWLPIRIDDGDCVAPIDTRSPAGPAPR
jgi:hypothetical protein